MAVQVRMPALGESVTEGTVTRWLKKEGEPVEAGEALLEVSTDKVDTEIPSPVGGILTTIVAAEEETVAVGGELAIVDDALVPPSVTGTPDAVRPASEPAVAARPDEPHFATSAVVAFAAEHGVALAAVEGSGPAGRIRLQDVHSAAGLSPWQPAHGPLPASAPPSFIRTTTQLPPRIPAVTAQPITPAVAPAVMNGNVPVLTAGRTVLRELDVTKVEALRARSAAEFATREAAELTFVAFIGKAVADGLRAVPALNAATGSGDVNLGIEADGGLAGTVIKDVGGLTLAGIARRSGEAVAGSDSPSTFTIVVTDCGDLVDIPVLGPGHAGALGVGTVIKRPRIVPGPEGGDAIGSRSVCMVALTYDHKLVTPADARSFLAAVADRLEGCRFDVRPDA